MHGKARAFRRLPASLDPALDRIATRGPGVTHVGGEQAQCVANLAERAVERKSVGIIREGNVTRGAGDAIETKERNSREIGRGQIGNQFTGSFCDERNIGRDSESTQIGDAMGQYGQTWRSLGARWRMLPSGATDSRRLSAGLESGCSR